MLVFIIKWVHRLNGLTSHIQAGGSTCCRVICKGTAITWCSDSFRWILVSLCCFFFFFSFLSFNFEGAESSAPLQGLVHYWSKQYCGHVGKLSIWLGFADLHRVILLVIYEYADDLWAVGKMFMKLKGFANFSTKTCFVQKNVNCDFIIQPCLFSCIKSLWSSMCAVESNHVVQMSSHIPWTAKSENPCGRHVSSSKGEAGFVQWAGEGWVIERSPREVGAAGPLYLWTS